MKTLAIVIGAVWLLVCGLAGAQGGPARIGFLATTVGEDRARAAFVAGMRDLGYEDGRNLRIETVHTARDQGAVENAVEQLLRAQVRLIVAQGPVAPQAHKALRGRLPMVFAFSGDPVEAGLVQSLGRPGGSSTGITMLAFETVGKRLELFKELKPGARRVAILVRPAHPGAKEETRVSVQAAQRLGLQTVVVEVDEGQDVPAALARIKVEKVDGVVVFPDASMLAVAPKMAEFSRAERLLFVMGWKEFTAAGMPAAFGPSALEAFRDVARHVDRILKGADPRNVPTEQASRFYVTFNRKALAAIGVEIPHSLLMRADEVIE